MMPISTDHYADLTNGIRLHYASRGQRGAPLVLFMHGFPEFWGAWQDVLPHMSGDVFSVAPDLRGFNLSSQPIEVEAYRAKEIVTDMLLLVEWLGYDRVVVVGHDWGGAAAWQLGIHCPDVVTKLVIVNSPHPIPFARGLLSDPGQQAASAYMNWLRAPDAEGPLTENNFARLLEFFTRMQRTDAPWFNEQRADEYRRVWSRGLAGGLNYYRASPLHPPLAGESEPRRLKLYPQDFVCRVPTLILWGMADTALPATLLDGLIDVVPQLRVEPMARGTHWLIHEEPQFVANRILEFIAAR